MKRAGQARLDEYSFLEENGRLRLRFRLDSLEHTVHALYHDPPALPGELWAACLEELALACLVDVSTACMARRASVPFRVGRYGRKCFLQAAEALRIEVVADNQWPLRGVPFGFQTGGGAGRAVSTEIKPKRDRVLLLMGGGKDSLYCYHLLKSAGYDVECFYMVEPSRCWQQHRRVYRKLSSQAVQHRAFLNVSQRGRIERVYGEAYLSQFQIGEVIALSLPYALGRRCRYVVLGLEKSSDIPMADYRGRQVNHQQQKSSGFIRLLNRHLGWRFRNAMQVVSPLHGLYDLGIYARFLRDCPELVKMQSSCGGANTYRKHCGKCEKCAFLAALLAGLSGNKALYRSLFPEDPLQNVGLFEGWLDGGFDRPLTCAGLKQEVWLALRLMRMRNWNCPVLEKWDGGVLRDEKHELEHFLGTHPNGLLPQAMKKRLAPLLRYSVQELPG